LKSIIGGILGGSLVAIIVIGLIILMPTQIEAIQEITIKESRHPCQQAVIDDFQLAKKNAIFASSPYSGDDLEKWKIEYAATERNIKQLVLDNKCGENLNPDWFDDKFKQEYQAMIDAGF